MNAILPSEYYLSALPSVSSRVSIFRPRQLGDLIFPEIGMIMYPLYWCKYFLYLVAKGYRQDDPLWLPLTFFVVLDGNSIREESYQDSVLFLLLRNSMNDISRNATEIGSEWASRTPRGWLFECEDWLDECRDMVLDWSRDKTDEAIARGLHVFGVEFQQIACEVYGTPSFQDVLSQQLSGLEATSHERAVLECIEKLCIFLARVFKAKDPKGALLEPNYNFVKGSILEGDWGRVSSREFPELSILANVDCSTPTGLTSTEAKAFLRNLSRSEKGTGFVASVILHCFLESIDLKAYAYIGCYDRVTTNQDQLIHHLGQKWTFIKEPERFVSFVEESAVAWELNYLLYLGEGLMKSWQEILATPFTAESIRHLLENDRSEVNKFKALFQDFATTEQMRKTLQKLMEKYERRGETDVAEFLKTFLRGFAKGLGIHELVFSLLKLNDNFKQLPDGSLRLRKQDLPEPQLVGETSFHSWRESLLNSLGEVL